MQAAGLEVMVCQEGLFTTETNKKSLAIRGLGHRSAVRCEEFPDGGLGVTLAQRLMNPRWFDPCLLTMRFPVLTMQSLADHWKRILSKTPFFWRFAG